MNPNPVKRTAPIGLVAIASLLLVTARAVADEGTAKFDAQMAPIVEQYIAIHDALASDHTKGVTDAAKAIAKHIAGLDATIVKGEHAGHYKDIPQKMAESAAKLVAAKDLGQARDAMKVLSRPLAMWATMSKPKNIDVVFCSMAKGSWLQRPGAIRNPYYGASMLACGEVVAGATQGAAGGHMKGGH